MVLTATLMSARLHPLALLWRLYRSESENKHYWIRHIRWKMSAMGYQYTTLISAPPTHIILLGRGPRVVVSTAAFHASVRGSVPGLGGLKETKMFLPHPRVKVSIVGSLRDREVACSASDRQGSNFESCVWRTVSSQSSHHPQEVLLAQFSLYVHKGGLKPDSFHFIYIILFDPSMSKIRNDNFLSEYAETCPLRCL